MAGLRKSDLKDSVIEVQNKIVRKRKKGGALEIEKTELKTPDRGRRIPITEKLDRLLQEVLLRTDADYEYVFSMEDGSKFNPDNFREAAWATEFRRSGIDYERPYATRHSFAAWCLILRMDPNRLVYLNGILTKR